MSSYNPDFNTLIGGWGDPIEQRSKGEHYKIIMGVLATWYEIGAYGASWADIASHLPDNPPEGRTVIRHNTDESETRQYFFVNSAWEYLGIPDPAGVTDHGGLTGLLDPADHPWAFLIDGTRAMTGDLDMDGNSINNIGRLLFDTSFTNGHFEGQVHWDDNDKCLSYDTEVSGTRIQIGQEQVVRCTNKTGVTIANGSAIYVTGSQGQRPTIALAKADDINTSITTIGVTTNEIENNLTGYVTTFGLVRDFDTSAFSEGDFLYLSATTAGGLTNTLPTPPNIGVWIGVCLYSHATEGIIAVRTVNIQRLGYLSDVNDRGTRTANQAILWNEGEGYFEPRSVIDDKTGWNAEVQDNVSLSFNNSLRRLTISFTGTVTYYIQGTKYEKTGSETVDLTDTEGMWYIYYSGSTLTASQTPWSIRDNDKALVAFVYWDAINNESKGLGWELHGWVMDASTHHHMHYSLGTTYIDGLTASIVGSNDEFLNLTEGEIEDEDIEIDITDGAGGALFEQELTYLNSPIIYLDGSSYARSYTSSTTPVQLSNNNVLWNSSGTPTESSLNEYTAMWIIASNEVNKPIFLVMGTGTPSNNLTVAILNNPINSISWGDLPFPEFRILYRAMVKNIAGAPYYIISELSDFRSENPVGRTVVDHDHDDRYYTESEIDTFLAGKSDTTHNHDTRYYTESEMDTFLAGKSDTTHNHDADYLKLTGGTMGGNISMNNNNVIMGGSGILSFSSTNLYESAASVLKTDDALVVGSIAAAVADYDKFLVSNSGKLNFRTGAEVLSDIGAAASSHNHDDRYYTESEMDTFLAGKSDTTHNHDTRYYTETELNALLKIGSANAEYVSLALFHNAAPTKDFRSGGWGFTSNITAGVIYQYYTLSGIALSEGGNDLQISKVNFRVVDADATDYVDEIEVRGISYTTGTSTQVFLNTTNRTSPITLDLTCSIDTTAYDLIVLRVKFYSTTAVDIDITLPRFKCHYD